MQSSLEMEVAEADQQVSTDLLLRRANVSPFLTSSSRQPDLQFSPGEIPSREPCTIPPLDLGNCPSEESIVQANKSTSASTTTTSFRPFISFTRALRKIPSSSSFSSSRFGGACPVCPSSCVSDFFNSFQDPLAESSFSSASSSSMSSITTSTRSSLHSTPSTSSSKSSISRLRNRRQMPLPEINTKSSNNDFPFESRTKKKTFRKTSSDPLDFAVDPLVAPFTPCVSLERISPNTFDKRILVSDSDARLFSSGMNLILRNSLYHPEEEPDTEVEQHHTSTMMSGHACPTKAALTLKTRPSKKTRQPKNSIKVLHYRSPEIIRVQKPQQEGRPKAKSRQVQSKPRTHGVRRVATARTQARSEDSAPVDYSPSPMVYRQASARSIMHSKRFTKQDEMDIMYSGELELKLDKAVPLALVCPSAIKHPKSPLQTTPPGLQAATVARINSLTNEIKRSSKKSLTTQDRVSALLIAKNSPPEPKLPTRRIGAYGPKERVERIKRFQEKRKQLKYVKRIKYVCRHKLAQSCPRVKGRFVSRQEYEQAIAQGKAKPIPEFEAIKDVKHPQKQLQQYQQPQIKQELGDRSSPSCCVDPLHLKKEVIEEGPTPTPPGKPAEVEHRQQQRQRRSC